MLWSSYLCLHQLRESTRDKTVKWHFCFWSRRRDIWKISNTVFNKNSGLLDYAWTIIINLNVNLQTTLQIMSCIVYNGPGPNGSPSLLPSTFALPKEDEVSHHHVLPTPMAHFRPTYHSSSFVPVPLIYPQDHPFLENLISAGND